MTKLAITGIIDGPLTGGIPKAIEFFALEDIADLSVYGVEAANNGAPSTGAEFTFPAVAVSKGTYIYVASEAPGFTDYFGFAPTYLSAVADINGDDAIVLFEAGTAVDAFGTAGQDGTGTAWDHVDGWAYRAAGTLPSAVFDASQWSFSGTNALDDATSNAMASKPFPLGSFMVAVPQALLINEVLGSTTGTDVEYVELIGTPGESLAGKSLIIVEGDAGSSQGSFDARYDFTDEKIGDNGYLLLGNTLVSAPYGVTPNVTLPGNYIENSTYTIALVETASLSGTSVSGTEVVLDAVAVTDGGADDLGYFGAPVLGPDGSFLPAGVGRVVDGVDTNTAADFKLLDFNLSATVNTPTAGTFAPDAVMDVKVHDIQGETNLADGTLVGVAGAADESPLLGQVVRIQAVVTQVMPGLGGFYVQEEDADADTNDFTSEGIFVTSSAAVTAGHLVTVEGTVVEAGGETRLAATSVSVDSTANALPDATVITFPTATVLRDKDGDYVANLEAYEGMRVTIPEEMTVSELFQLNRFGTMRLTSEGRIETFTQSNAPSVTGYQDHLKDVGARSIVIDDGSNLQNPADLLVPFLGADGTLDGGDVFRMGDSYAGLTGVLSFSEDSASFSEEPEYRLHTPTEGSLTQNNPRTEAPADVGGSLRVAAFNVLNYFTSIDDNTGKTGPDGTQEARGANNVAEFERQEAKLVAAIKAVAADVVGLIEIENDPMGSTSLIALVSALNAAGGTYAYVDAGVIEGAIGGLLEGDAIKQAFIYDYTTVELNGDFALLDETVDARFQTVDTQRPVLAQTFTEIATGESFTAAVAHLKSKGSAVDGDVDQFDGQGASATVRTNAAMALADWLASDPTNTGEDNVLLLGDLNAYRMEDAIQTIRAGADGILGTADDNTDLGATYDAGSISYVFDGRTGTLDYAFASASLAGQVSGAAYWNINADEALALDYNLDFGRDPSLFTPDAFRASDHDPIVVGLTLSTEPEVYTLELLHLTDQEGSSSSVVLAANASAILNALELQDLGADGLPDNTIRLSSGDAFIPGVFFDASQAVFGSAGIADIQIQNELGFQAIAFGNHEFDKGTATLAGLISGSADGDFAALEGSTLEGLDFAGTNMPYLSTNLDFSTDKNLAPLQVAGGKAPVGNAVTSSTVIEEGGELIGVVGATTPTLGRISSPGSVGIAPVWAGTVPTSAELDALAAEIQAEVDALLAANPTMNKVILLAHMQQISIELELASRLSNVDIIVAGGSNTRLFDADDRIIPGDSNQGQYPLFITNADGGVTAVVNTDGSYKYVGRLVIDFDSEGRIIADSYDASVSGAYATDDAGVDAVGAEGLVDPEVAAIAAAIEEQIIETQSNVFGVANVFLNGNRTGTGDDGNPDGVRSQETNLGNLTADANLAYAQQVDNTVLVSIKNGGGIRTSIGETVVPPGGSDFVRQPNGELLDSAGNVIKPEGGISEADIKAALAFNNTLSLVTLTRAELVAVLEHGVANVGAGQFAQVSGVQIAFDPTLPAGDRIISAAITDADGKDIDVLVKDGALVGNADATVRVVTLSFLVEGGDGYPFPKGPAANRVDLKTGDVGGVATFAETGSEQDAFAEYLAAFFATPDTAYDVADADRTADSRIQNLAYRDDTVIDEPEFEFVFGTAGRDRLHGSEGADIIISGAGNFDTSEGFGGADVFYFGTEALDTRRERDSILDYEVGVDAIGLASGVDVLSIRQVGNKVVVYLDGPRNADDAIYVSGNGVTASNLTILHDYDLLLA
ncbi:MAG: ExeM/NucH family extracellular endonuclease [Rhodobacteraceae bacterium]|nr:ExeM/NucH family extracellular endonuclease [Paracoccaceae bacterium]